MPETNLIVNGTFDDGSTGWSGTDLETNYTEDAYLKNGSSNRVAEMDGRAGRITVMEQSFEVNSPWQTELTLDAALRNSVSNKAGVEGLTAEVLDAGGNVIATQVIYPQSTSYTTFTMPISFPSAGTYTLRMTELGTDNSNGAIIDNVAIMVCFHGSTKIAVPGGEKPAREIAPGDLVVTGSGLRAVRWVGRRHVSAQEMAQDAKFAPVRICAGALGDGLPKADLLVSRQHRMWVNAAPCLSLFGVEAALVAAVRLTDLPGIYADQSVGALDYIHILFDQHEVVFAEGAPSESMLFGAQAKAALTVQARAQLQQMFGDAPEAQAAAFIPPRKEQRLLVHSIKQAGVPALAGYCAAPLALAG
ncbi:MAG: Hint domain-containing protein [Sulfitobacter sp.]